MDARAIDPPDPRPQWAYFLDLDGTLVDIAPTPHAVRVEPALVAQIRRLHAACGGAAALVSGRAIADLDRHLGLVTVPAAGQHGLERRDAAGGVRRLGAPPSTKPTLLAAIAAAVAAHPSLVLEDKGLTLALHYRLAPQLEPVVTRLMNDLVQLAGAGYTVQPGKQVAELKSAHVDKGTAVAAFLDEPPFAGRLPVFIGDDLTDESAFAEVNRRGGVSIKVGPGASVAAYRLAGVAAVRRWLDRMREGES